MASATASTRKDCVTAGNFSTSASGCELEANRPFCGGPAGRGATLHNSVTVAYRLCCFAAGRRSGDLNAHGSSIRARALVLNADFRRLSYYPLWLWSWHDAYKAVFLDQLDSAV